jgi:hypothetical protein
MTYIFYKAKAVPLHAMKALGGRGGITPTHSWPRHYMGLSGQRHAPEVFTLSKGPPVPIVQEAGWTPESVWTQRIEKKNLPGIEPRSPSRPARSQTLYRLVYAAHIHFCNLQLIHFTISWTEETLFGTHSVCKNLYTITCFATTCLYVQ